MAKKSQRRKKFDYRFKQHHLPKRQKKGSLFLKLDQLPNPKILKLINAKTAEEYKKQIRKAKKPVISDVSMIAQNSQDANLCKLSPKLKKLTRAHKAYLYRLIKEGLTIDQRRRVLQQGEGFGVIPALLAGLLPTLISGIGGLISGKRNE